MARVKQIIGWTAIVLFAVTLAGIWVLTEQNAVETSLLSESTARVVEGQATGVQAADATGEAQTENGMTGGTDSAASNVRSGRLASIRMWVGTNVRRVAHTVEFFFVGLFASVVVVCFSRRPWSVCSRCMPVLLFCAACSVGDQVHKIFVPGRHFDVIERRVIHGRDRDVPTRIDCQCRGPGSSQGLGQDVQLGIAIHYLPLSAATCNRRRSHDRVFQN